MAKLTETTNDQLKEPKRRGRPPKNAGVPNGSDGGPLHVIAQHEPLQSNPAPWIFQNTPVQAGPFSPVMVVKSPQAQQPIPQPMPQAPLKVALIGTAPSSRMLAPYNDPTWKIWACSPGNMNALPRVDAWFEIHGSLLWPEHKHYGEPYLAWLSQLKIPVYMQDQRYIPHAITLPKDKLVEEFGPYYFTSSFAWMMAMAMHEGATEIALYGIDMASRDEYILQRPGAYHFFQKARERGIKITAPHESDILQPPGLYGYSEVTPLGRKLLARKQEITERLNALRQERDRAITQITYLEGALEDNDYTISIWGGVQNNPPPS